MLRNKKFQLVLSLLIAIALWLYVVGDINPTITADKWTIAKDNGQKSS